MRTFLLALRSTLLSLSVRYFTEIQAVAGFSIILSTIALSRSDGGKRNPKTEKYLLIGLPG